jgi:hypothetical protein
VPNVLRDTLSAEANLKQPKLLCEVKDFWTYFTSQVLETKTKTVIWVDEQTPMSRRLNVARESRWETRSPFSTLERRTVFEHNDNDIATWARMSGNEHPGWTEFITATGDAPIMPCCWIETVTWTPIRGLPVEIAKIKT